MPRERFANEQIAFALGQAENDAVVDVVSLPAAGSAGSKALSACRNSPWKRARSMSLPNRASTAGILQHQASRGRMATMRQILDTNPKNRTQRG